MSSTLGLSESPASVFAELYLRNSPKELSLKEFLEKLPAVIDENKKSKNPEDLIGQLMERLVLDPEDYQQYAHFESSKNYTRNLIATDDKRYTLLLLCWNASRESPIHDHPCDGCWMRVVTGSVQECRYVKQQNGVLQCVSNQVYNDGQLAFIQDSMGYHKVGNPHSSKPAITLHLYCPPFQECKIWMDPSQNEPSQSCVCYHSEYGIVL